MSCVSVVESLTDPVPSIEVPPLETLIYYEIFPFWGPMLGSI